MDQIELKVDSRRILGKKVRSLRRQGITPVHLFSRDIESMALQCETTILRRVLAKAGKTGLISLKVDSEIKPRTVVVRKVQVEPRTSEILHVDFAQIRMEEEVKVEVPVVLSGESPALKAKENTLVRELNTLNISCLPASIPAGIELDITSLTDPDQAIRVKDIEPGGDITILNDPESVVVRISSRYVEKTEGPPVAKEAMAAPEEAPSDA